MTTHDIIRKALRWLIHEILTATAERLVLTVIYLLTLTALLTLLLLTYLLHSRHRPARNLIISYIVRVHHDRSDDWRTHGRTTGST